MLGNHDVDPMNRNFAADHRHLSLFMPGDPPLLLTHLPLGRVPEGAVNVHGHLHLKAPPTPDRHISVCVEQLNYRPARMRDIRRLARLLARGRAGGGPHDEVPAQPDGPPDATGEEGVRTCR